MNTEEHSVRREASVEPRFEIGTLFREVNRRVAEGGDYEAHLDFVFESLHGMIPYDRIGVGLLDETKNVNLAWMHSNLPTEYLKPGFSAPLEGSSLENLLLTGEPRIIPDLVAYLNKHPNSKSTFAAINDGIRSSLTLPLRAEGKAIGFVFFSSGQTDTYHTQHIKLCFDIAEQMSWLVHYGQLKKFFRNSKNSDRFLRTALHDLRSPVGIFQGYLDLISTERWYKELDDRGRGMLRSLRRNAEYMMKLINDLSRYNSANEESEKLHLAIVSLPEFFINLEQDWKMAAKKKSIDFKVCVDEFISREWCFDADRIREVFDNLISNAIKFSMSGSSISLSVNTVNQRLVVSVKDSGQGIPSEEFKKLFIEFGKTSVKPTAGEVSTGLGLAISKRIVEGHGGEIRVESKSGKGSEFIVSLPQTAPSSMSYTSTH